MKAEELMVGDWVRITDDDTNAFFDAKVGTLTRVENIFVVPPGEEMAQPFSIDCVEPIPITPEILEKNGFVQNPRSKSRRSHQICTDSVYISWWRGRFNILFKPFIGHSTNHVNVDGKYVHDLQHALRLCGINKTIEL